jgi:hypothetical protein
VLGNAKCDVQGRQERLELKGTLTMDYLLLLMMLIYWVKRHEKSPYRITGNFVQNPKKTPI